MENNTDDRRKETLIKEHRLHLHKRSEIAKEVSRLRSRKKPRRDTNAIVSLDSIVKKSKQRALDIKRTAALERKHVQLSSSEYKLLFVVRNRRSVESSTSRSMLQSLGLSQIGTGRFFSNSESNLKALRVVLPFVYYGIPTLKHVKELLHKRGTIVLPNGEHKLLNTNMVVEEHFGHSNVLCIADVVESIYNGSDISDDILSKLGALHLAGVSKDGPIRYGDVGTSINEHLRTLI
ncbi:putative 60S ribosomal protein L7-like 1 [Babesia divergens]|uniref:60S ribosomal protein L7-like 1 n=1 Tax=Babesia divergens TaxID=32595 RepID=A0AAD9LKM3_BABDI|nr:putative 60S ribosomal protein L7-like 1 [Babesia divergens]